MMTNWKFVELRQFPRNIFYYQNEKRRNKNRTKFKKKKKTLDLL